MAIRRSLFKTGVIPEGAARLVMLRFPCNRIEQSGKKPRNIESTSEKHPMIDQQIDIPTGDGHATTFISHPEYNLA
jgi:hypothetical protein